ncbi:MAG TPA: hypothetical protein VGB00_03390 [Pyrinomonadaceae bacterium]|jgi:hypothetical protein
MKRIFSTFVFFAACSVFFALSAFGQNLTFSDLNAAYTFDLPEATWKQTVKPNAGSSNVEYVYGDRRDGHLEIRKITVAANEMLSDVILREQEQKLQFLPGYVAGKEENFAGALRGKVFNFEYVRSGRNVSGRFYFLKSDETTVYVVRFTGERDKLRAIRNQTDSIARTFKLKTAEKQN